MLRPILLATLLLGAVTFAGCASNDEKPSTQRNETKTFTLKAGESVEYKLRMAKGAKLDYSWSSPRALSYDFHGDKDGARADEFTSHKKGTATTDQAVFTAPFDGRHGWYWKNNNRAEATITLTTKGVYDVVGVVG